MTSAFPLDINAITADKIDAIELEGEISLAKKKAGAKAKTKQALEGDLEAKLAAMNLHGEGASAPSQKRKRPAAKPKPEITREDVKIYQQNLEEAERGQHKKEIDRIMTRINLYQMLMPQSCVGLDIPSHPTKEQGESILRTIRSRNSLRNLKPSATMALCMAIQLLEYVTHDAGYNPMGFKNIRGLAKLIEQHPEVLEDELTEMAIELHWIFEQNWAIRLGQKIFKVAKEYDDKKAISAAEERPVPADLDQRFSAL